MIETKIKGIELKFHTEESLFSPGDIDRGTLAMLSVIDFAKSDKVLDLGCGYGVVGILAAKLIGADKVVMLDNDPIAVDYARRNALQNGVSGILLLKSDGFKGLQQGGFTKIICHPPYHVDFSVPKMFIEKGFNRLALGGRFYMVTKRLEWYKNKIAAIFGGVTVHEVDGYFVFVAEKRDMRYANRK